MPLKTNQEELQSINLTSMIDVVFLLIIFFMVGTKFSEMEKNVSIDLPSSSGLGAMIDKPAKRVVNVTRDGAIEMLGRSFSLTQLKTELIAAKASYPDLSVEVRGDRNAPYGPVAEVFDVVRQAGISGIDIPFQTRR